MLAILQASCETQETQLTEITEHVGITALDAERANLLRTYDTAVEQGIDDAVRTEHGVSCEALFRKFLEQFLPRKYGVTKGYIITPDLDYAGPLEEWDIIIYDVLESPVLFVRRTSDQNETAGKRGIPVEYVRGVVEVKATLTKGMVQSATEKLLKLRTFQRPQRAKKDDSAYLPSGFRAAAVFFETKVKDAMEYADALGAMAPFWQADPLIQFIGALILRGQTQPEFSASTSYFMTGMETLPDDLLNPSCEVSRSVPSYVSEMYVNVVSGGFGPNEFWRYMIDLVHALNGHDDEYCPPRNMTGGYGVRQNGHTCVRLFPKKLS